MIGIGAASNYIDNGDFEQPLSVGWVQTAAGGGTTINRGTTYDPDSDYEVYLYKATGTTGYAQLWQIADVPTGNLDVSLNAKLYAWDNHTDAWAGAAVVIAYLDDANTQLGETRIANMSAGCPWANTADRHIIAIYDSLWHNYSFNIYDELANVPAVDPDEVAKIKITLDAQVVHC
jgi:hypothetical protein